MERTELVKKLEQVEQQLRQEMEQVDAQRRQLDSLTLRQNEWKQNPQRCCSGDWKAYSYCAYKSGKGCASN